jgi:hypothetical protein
MNDIARPAANPRKTTSIRKLGSIDIAALLAAVQAIPEAVWDAENADKPNKFEALDKTRHIVFRFVDSTRDARGVLARGQESMHPPGRASCASCRFTRVGAR